MSSASRLARCCHGLTVEGHQTHSPTPRRLRWPSHPNLESMGVRETLRVEGSPCGSGSDVGAICNRGCAEAGLGGDLSPSRARGLGFRVGE